jgi:hypothetical protein
LPPETPSTGRNHEPGKVHARNSKQKTNRKLEGNKDPPPGAVQEHPDKVRKVTGKFFGSSSSRSVHSMYKIQGKTDRVHVIQVA